MSFRQEIEFQAPAQRRAHPRRHCFGLGVRATAQVRAAAGHETYPAGWTVDRNLPAGTRASCGWVGRGGGGAARHLTGDEQGPAGGGRRRRRVLRAACGLPGDHRLRVVLRPVRRCRPPSRITCRCSRTCCPRRLDIVREQITRITAKPSELGVAFAGGLLLALWSANAGVKAMIDALNVIEEQDERRSFVRLNACRSAYARRDRVSCCSRSARWWRFRW